MTNCSRGAAPTMSSTAGRVWRAKWNPWRSMERQSVTEEFQQEDEILGKAYDARLDGAHTALSAAVLEASGALFRFSHAADRHAAPRPVHHQDRHRPLHRHERPRRPGSHGAGLCRRRALRLYRAVHSDLHDPIHRPARHARSAHGYLFAPAEAGHGLLRPQRRRPADDPDDQRRGNLERALQHRRRRSVERSVASSSALPSSCSGSIGGWRSFVSRPFR